MSDGQKASFFQRLLGIGDRPAEPAKKAIARGAPFRDRKLRAGSIISLSSAAGRLGFPLRSPYAASKWAVVGLTQTLAMELGPANIRVNCIQPGIVEGERIDRVIDAKSKALSLSLEEYKTRLLSRVSLRRMVSAQDIANMALFLASKAGRNISGQSLSVCGNVETLG